MNTCGLPCEYVVVGPQVNASTGEPVICVLTCCAQHLSEVRRFQSQWAGIADIPVGVGPIEDLDLIVPELLAMGPVVLGARSVA